MRRLCASLFILCASLTSQVASSEGARDPSEACESLEEAPCLPRTAVKGRERILDAGEKRRIESGRKDEEYLKDWPINLLLGSAKMKLEGGYTNNAGSQWGPSAVPAELDDELVGEAKLGWFEKPILRDAYLLLGPGKGTDRLAEYRGWEDDWIRWAALDALKLSAHAGYGSKLTDHPGDDSFTVEGGTIFYVGLSYELPLEELGQPFEEE